MFYRLPTGSLPFKADTPIAHGAEAAERSADAARGYRDRSAGVVRDHPRRGRSPRRPRTDSRRAEEFRSALLSAIGHSNAPAGMSGSEYMTAPFAAPAIAVRPHPSRQHPRRRTDSCLLNLQRLRWRRQCWEK